MLYVIQYIEAGKYDNFTLPEQAVKQVVVLSQTFNDAAEDGSFIDGAGLHLFLPQPGVHVVHL